MSRSEPLTVTETIHHGDYRNVRTVVMQPTWEGFVTMLHGSPYNGGKTPDVIAGNRYAAQLFANLLTKGRGAWGWADYRVS